MELPGGVYNFGSECDGDMVETARCFANLLQVDVNIRRLRMKVEDEPSHPAHILTVWGYGYRWEE